MAWNRQGSCTVTLGSRNVSGVDTVWSTTVKAGDMFGLGVGSPLYEVESVTSNTAMVLKTAYQEATQAAASYFTVPLSVKWQLGTEVAQQLANLISDYQSRIDAQTGALKGDKGDPGLVMSGNWSSSASYVPLNVVVYNNKVWLCKLGNRNQAPAAGSNYWVEMSTQIIENPPGVPA